MKKLLISILIILLIVMAYFAIFKGLSFGTIKILSVEQIKDANDNLTKDIEETNSLLKKEYPMKKEELTESVTELLQQKEEYFTLARISTEGEITKANTEETYLIEYLWTRVGRHATSKGVNLKMDVNSGDTGEADMKNLSFTVTGQYIGIIQFVSALENDDKLNFKIENFKMVKKDTENNTEDNKQEETNLTATFNVRSIRIKSERTSGTVVKQDTTVQQNTNSEEKVE